MSALVRCQDAITAIIAGLDLVGLTVTAQKSANVLITPALPAAIISITGFNDSPSSRPFAFTKQVLTGLRVAVAIMDHSSSLAQDADKYMVWREAMELACHVPTLSGVPELFRTAIEGGERIEDEVKQKTGTPKMFRFVSGFVVRCDILRIRG